MEDIRFGRLRPAAGGASRKRAGMTIGANDARAGRFYAFGGDPVAL